FLNVPILAQCFCIHPDQGWNERFEPSLFVSGSLKNQLLELDVDVEILVDEVTTANAGILSQIFQEKRVAIVGSHTDLDATKCLLAAHRKENLLVREGFRIKDSFPASVLL